MVLSDGPFVESVFEFGGVNGIFVYWSDGIDTACLSRQMKRGRKTIVWTMICPYMEKKQIISWQNLV